MKRADFVKEIEQELGYSAEVKMGGAHWLTVKRIMTEIADLAEKNDQEDSYYSAEGHNREIDFPADLER
tara:strand:+ start:398 stop:604 length:207 start_codon:yes stop_codon:yes gene_type:complete